MAGGHEVLRAPPRRIPVLFRMDEETAHERVLAMVEPVRWLPSLSDRSPSPVLTRNVGPLTWTTPSRTTSPGFVTTRRAVRKIGVHTPLVSGA